MDAHKQTELPSRKLAQLLPSLAGGNSARRWFLTLIPKVKIGLIVRVLPFLMVFCSLVSVTWAEWNEKVLYSFQGGPIGHDGDEPAGGVVLDNVGNVYGVTLYGGSRGCGIMYQLTSPASRGGKWTETVLHVFRGPDGCWPSGGLIADSAGNFYGVTAEGGIESCLHVGCGTVYELLPPAQKGGAWTETVLYRFRGGKDGVFPYGALVFDSVGNLYGGTFSGGGKGTCSRGGPNCGTLFRLSPPKHHGGPWIESVLHRFAGIGTGKRYGDGAEPNGGLVLDGSGTIYGTTRIGGADVCGSDGCGTVFALVPPTTKGKAWEEKILHRFDLTTNDGYFPISGGLTFDAKGSLYGTTVSGGSGNCSGGCGTVYRLTPAKSGRWAETVLYNFQGATDGLGPVAPVAFDSSGNLYGTTGGDGGISSWGTVFKLAPPAGNAPQWSITGLYSFAGSPDGWSPAAPLTFWGGAVFSTTAQGGTGRRCKGNCGTVFKIWPQ